MTATGAPEPRIGDADREAAVSALGEHYAAGRLTREELDERCELAWAARTASQLWPLFVDLPRPQTARPTAVPSGSTAWPARAPGRRPRSPFGPVLTTVLVVLALVVALTHLPLILLVVGIWFLLSRHQGWQKGLHRGWQGDGRHHPHRGDWIR